MGYHMAHILFLNIKTKDILLITEFFLSIKTIHSALVKKEYAATIRLCQPNQHIPYLQWLFL
jgi:hypothetical protein